MGKQLPKYHETFISVLKVLNDSGTIHYAELERKVRDEYYNDLPQELLAQKTKGGSNIILSRIGWARVYLKQAEMIEQPERAMVRITDKGKRVLKSGQLTLKQVLNDPDFKKNQHEKILNKKRGGKDKDSSPEDLIDSGFDSIESQVKNDLLKKLMAIDPYFFEEVVGKLFRAMGYGDFTVTARSRDGGIDGVINQDQLGLEKIYIQAKRYAENNKIREPLIRDFIGAMSRSTKKGIFVTTSSFDESAIKKANEADHIIKLIDGQTLVDLMHKHNIGVQTKNTYEVKQIDEDFFSV